MKPIFFYIRSINAVINLNYVIQVSKHERPEAEGKAFVRICLCGGNEIVLSEDTPDVHRLKEVLAEFIQLPPDETAATVCTQ